MVFGGSLRLEIFGGNLFKDVADARNESSDHRNLSTEGTEDTDILGSLRLEIFGGNLY